MFDGSTPLVSVAVGQAVRIAGSAASLSGWTRLTVLSFTHPVDNSTAQPVGRGIELAVADIEMCVDGEARDNGAAANNFQVVMSAGINAHRAKVDAKRPSLATVERFEPNECVRGYLTFEVRTGSDRPVAVQLGFGSSGAINWALPGSPSAEDPVINDDTPTVTVTAGVAVRLAGDASGFTGATSMTVHSYKGPIPHPGSEPLPPGEEVGAADAEFCGSEETTAVQIPSYVLVLASGAEVASDVLPGEGVEPALDGTPDAGAAPCQRGWVTFHVPKGSKPVAVVFDFPTQQRLRWTLPATP